MSIESSPKIKRLYRDWPSGAVLTSAALKRKGYSDQLINRYRTSGWLTSIGWGAFRRQNEKPDWRGALYAMQQDLGIPVHVGGITALELNGVAHYLPLGTQNKLYFYNTSSAKVKLPLWYYSLIKSSDNEGIAFVYRQNHLFEEETGLQTYQFGELELLISTPERSILEWLLLQSKMDSIEHAINLVEGLSLIRPKLTQKLLESCSSIVTKRLFLCLAEICQLPVLKHLQPEKIDLGQGVRTIQPGGKYYKKYQLVLPHLNNDDYNEDMDI